MNTPFEEDLRRLVERKQAHKAQRRLWIGRIVFVGYWWLICLSCIPLVLSSPRDVTSKVIIWGFTVPASAVGLAWSCKRFQAWLVENDL